MKKIYINCFDQNKNKQIIDLANELDLETASLKYDDLKKTVKAIIENIDEEITTIPLQYQMEEMLLFYNLNDNELNNFLQKYRQKGIQPISLKAIVTEYNYKWSLLELIEHLKQERAYYQQSSQK